MLSVRKASFGFLLSAALLTTWRLPPVSAEPLEVPEPQLVSERTDTSKAVHVPSQLIVKYKDSLPVCAHCLLRSRRNFSTALTDGAAFLDQLHQRYHVRRITPLFRTEAEDAVGAILTVRELSR